MTIKKMSDGRAASSMEICFAELHKYSMIFRLSDADREAFLALGNTGEFEPMTSRKMKGYVAMAGPLDRKPSVLAQ